VIRLGPHLELLARLAHREHEPSARLELIEQRARHVIRRRRDHDHVEGAFFGPSAIAVAAAQAHVLIAEAVEILPRALGDRGNDLDREHRARDLVEHRRLIARAGSDLEHLLAALQPARLGHERDDVGLGNGLVVPDGQRAVAIRGIAQLLRNEFVPRHGAHGRENQRVFHATRHDLLGDHAVASFGESGAFRQRSSHSDSSFRVSERSPCAALARMPRTRKMPREGCGPPRALAPARRAAPAAAA